MITRATYYASALCQLCQKKTTIKVTKLQTTFTLKIR